MDVRNAEEIDAILRANPTQWIFGTVANRYRFMSNPSIDGEIGAQDVPQMLKDNYPSSLDISYCFSFSSFSTLEKPQTMATISVAFLPYYATNGV